MARLSSKLKAASSQHFARRKKESSFNEALFRLAFFELFEEAQNMPRYTFFFFLNIYFIAKKDMDHKN